MSSTAGYETWVREHLLEIRDVRQRSFVEQMSPRDAAAPPTLVTGIDTGPVRIEVGDFDTPPDADLDGWDEAVEVSVQVRPGGVVIVGIEDDSSGMPRICEGDGGTYRFRVYARGRSLAYDSTASTAVESYRVEAWPGPWSAPAVLAPDSGSAVSDLLLFPTTAGMRVILDDGTPAARPVEDDRERTRLQDDVLKRMSRRRPE